MPRDFFSDVVGQSVIDDEDKQVFRPLQDIAISVYEAGTTDNVVIYSDRDGASQKANPFLTTTGGVVEFWAEPGEYDIFFDDLNIPARITDKTIGWTAGEPEWDSSGLFATRPAAGVQGRRYFALDQSQVYYDTGTAWIVPAPASSTITWPMLATATQELLVRPGQVGMTAASTPDPGYLMCDGSAVSRTTYAALFARIGTSYGVGNGSSTFGIPDFNGRMPVGKGSHADVNVLGDNDGLGVADRTPKHKHTVNSAGSHSHGGSIGGGGHEHTEYRWAVNWHIGAAGGGLQAVGGGQLYGPYGTGGGGGHSHGIGADGNHTHTVGPQTNAPTDGPAYQTVNFQIKI